MDKTDLVYSLANEGKVYFLSRPRRFGKSLLVSTLKCYFEGRKELFKGLKMEALEKDWKVYPVIRIDFNSDDFTKVNALEGALNSIVTKLERQYHVEVIDGRHKHRTAVSGCHSRNTSADRHARRCACGRVRQATA